MEKGKSSGLTWIVVLLALSLIGNGVLGYFAISAANRTSLETAGTEVRLQEIAERMQALQDKMELRKFYREWIAFLDTKIVQMIDDSTNLYHRYDCPIKTQNVGQKYFYLLYREQDAQKEGHQPCPECFE